MSPKGPPFEFFVILQQNACVEIKKGSPLSHFSALCDIFRKKNFFENFKFFPKKNVLRSLSLRYSAVFRRSRLVQQKKFVEQNFYDLIFATHRNIHNSYRLQKTFQLLNVSGAVSFKENYEQIFKICEVAKCF